MITTSLSSSSVLIVEQNGVGDVPPVAAPKNGRRDAPGHTMRPDRLGHSGVGIVTTGTMPFTTTPVISPNGIAGLSAPPRAAVSDGRAVA